MLRMIRTELMQLHTLRSSYFVALATIVISAVVAWADLADAGTKGLSTPGELRDALVMAPGLVTAMFVALFAASRTAGEYRNHTIAQRALASPRRGRLLAARLVTYGALSAVLGTVALAASYAIAGPVVDHEGLELALGSSDLLGIAGEVAAASGLFAMLGVGVGFITRSQAPAIIVIFGGFIVEKIVSGLIGTGGEYFPYALLNSLLDIDGPLAPAAAGLALTGVAAAVAASSAVLLRRRDVL
jgi:ABC-2 type transport system permease protein